MALSLRFFPASISGLKSFSRFFASKTASASSTPAVKKEKIVKAKSKVEEVKEVIQPAFGYVSIRKFRVLAPEKIKHVVELCGKEFVPLISVHPDFMAYYASLSAKQDEYTSVSIFRTKKGAEESVNMALDYNQKHLNSYLELLDHSEGETVVHADSWSVFHSPHSS